MFRIIVFLIVSVNAQAQHQDQKWLFGISSISTSDLDGYAWGNTTVDFSQSPPLVY